MENQILIFSEQSFLTCLSYSVLLTTVSLLFFHMTRVNSIELSHSYSSFFSIILIIMSIFYIILGLIQYAQRIANLLSKEHEKDKEKTNSSLKNEEIYWYIYLSLGIFFILLETFLCYVIIKKSLFVKNKI